MTENIANFRSIDEIEREEKQRLREEKQQAKVAAEEAQQEAALKKIIDAKVQKFHSITDELPRVDRAIACFDAEENAERAGMVRKSLTFLKKHKRVQWFLYSGLGIVTLMEAAFVLPEIVEAINMNFKNLFGFLPASWFAPVASLLLLGLTSWLVLVIKKFVRSPITILREKAGLIVDPSDPQAIAKARTHRDELRRELVFAVAVMAVFLGIIAGGFHYNHQVGSTYNELLMDLKETEKMLNTTQDPGSIFGAAPAEALIGPSPSPLAGGEDPAPLRDPKGMILFFLWVAHLSLLLIPVDYDAATDAKEKLEEEGASTESLASLTNKLHNLEKEQVACALEIHQHIQTLEQKYQERMIAHVPPTVGDFLNRLHQSDTYAGIAREGNVPVRVVDATLLPD